MKRYQKILFPFFISLFITSCKVNLFSFDVHEGDKPPPPPPPVDPVDPPPPPTPDINIKGIWASWYPEEGTMGSVSGLNQFQLIKIDLNGEAENPTANVSYCRFETDPKTNPKTNTLLLSRSFSNIPLQFNPKSLFSNSYLVFDVSTINQNGDFGFYDDWMTVNSNRKTNIQRKLMYSELNSNGNSNDLLTDYYQDGSLPSPEQWVVGRYVRIGPFIAAYKGTFPGETYMTICNW